MTKAGQGIPWESDSITSLGVMDLPERKYAEGALGITGLTVTAMGVFYVEDKVAGNTATPKPATSVRTISVTTTDMKRSRARVTLGGQCLLFQISLRIIFAGPKRGRPT